MNHLLLSLSCWMAVCSTTTLGFSPTQRYAAQQPSSLKNYYSRQTQSPLILFLVSGNEDSDFPPDDSADYSGDVDWDAEWKKVVAKDGKLEDGKERPGNDFYKSEAEIAAIKAANTATKKVAEAGSSVSNMMPDVRSLSGDWRFWIGVLALVSVGLSLLSAPSSDISTGLSGDSFYV
uniref:Uncharacterized protein n=1 Tax=Pseudo-nitzschia australis TaxID=44445 RepID=A0A7S4AXD6_9STRA|mmetsp:Transcript_200/g.486  ORF Transcript_200/g.486 Transcript_200/m.486 type:complete len:177 (+) Transcript_200:111-641(+)|eukprot:CAMPEP_0168193658 /NCGR_PEP_ID=MMETSP0139_2-20121125/18730_1 /TAXON_ID=44445 /ORGANISM="Pseudo-nitzschia australis, Strain 10249 10 AB" /LENGTH=176 /DNA_ID=CAMNT_0008117041 /DNA_START=56 /DNA_END=586 /DNA_ORIENTATION=+